MGILSSILFWVGIVALVDGSLGLLLEEKWQRMVEKWNIRKIALMEIAVAMALLVGHYLILLNMD